MENSESKEIEIPDFCVVVLIGASGSGKSTFARTHFLPSECLSSDAFRAMVSDDETDQSATGDAFEALHTLMNLRLKRRRLVVVDATNVQAEARKPLLALAKEHDCFAIAIVLDVPESLCIERNRDRQNRRFGPHVVANHVRQLRQSLRGMEREGFRHVHVLHGAEIEAASIRRVPLWNDRRGESGPFDIIGDVHGCYDELCALLDRLGYAPAAGGGRAHPEGRRVVFVGDLVDRGPKVVESARLAMAMAAAGTALCVPGNHDVKLARALKGSRVQVAHGLAESLAQIEALPEEERAAFRADFARFVDGLVSHLWLDGGALCVSHAGMKERYIGRSSGRVRSFALFGDTTGEIDEFGLPVRYPWAAEYRGACTVVYGHTPVLTAEWLNNTIDIDTGCVFGGSLTALRWPEREIVQVPALGEYATPARPLLTGGSDAALESGRSLQWEHDELLCAEDVLGKRLITTRLAGNIVIPAENSAAALEVMSRFAVEPRWLLYLPPTMSPCETAREGDLLERPSEAFAYYAAQEVETVICQRKHMGSRAVIVVCRDEEAARRRFGASDGAIGQIVTRTGRRFFDDTAFDQALLSALQDTLTRSDFWQEFETDWCCLDCEVMPWNVKAQALLREQYAPVASAAERSLAAAQRAVAAAVERGIGLDGVSAELQTRSEAAVRYRAAYGRYCWAVESAADVRIAPFHLLATEGRAHFDRDHRQQMALFERLSAAGGPLIATEHLAVQVGDPESCARADAWWRALTEDGGEGMVVKPLEWAPRGPRGLVQPAVKVRGREYLRIIYGPEYTLPENLARLRARALHHKRRLALREFALGVEAVERFVRREPLRRVHECVFGVLALESEPVDPRL